MNRGRLFCHNFSDILAARRTFWKRKVVLLELTFQHTFYIIFKIMTTSSGTIRKSYETEQEVEVIWEIENFLPFSGDPWERESPSFTWSAVNWELQMNSNSQKVLQLFLYKTAGKKLQVVFKYSIRLIDGTQEMRCFLNKSFVDSASGFGTYEFMLESEVMERKHELLPRNTLTLLCSISHLDTLIKPQSVKYEKLDVLSSHFKKLYGCAESCDLTIVVGEKRYPVHKIILAARSDVFASMFKHDMEEVNSGIVKVVDFDSNFFEDFLFYLYTGRVENFSSNNVCYLYKIADKYNVQDLKDLCISYMSRNMSAANIFDIVLLANQFNDAKLISISQEFFSVNALKVFRKEEWEQFVKQNFSIANDLLINMMIKKTDD